MSTLPFCLSDREAGKEWHRVPLHPRQSGELEQDKRAGPVLPIPEPELASHSPDVNHEGGRGQFARTSLHLRDTKSNFSFHPSALVSFVAGGPKHTLSKSNLRDGGCYFSLQFQVVIHPSLWGSPGKNLKQLLISHPGQNREKWM